MKFSLHVCLLMNLCVVLNHLILLTLRPEKTTSENDPISLHKANAAGNYLFLYMTVLLFPRHCNGDVR